MDFKDLLLGILIVVSISASVVVFVYFLVFGIYFYMPKDWKENENDKNVEKILKILEENKSCKER